VFTLENVFDHCTVLPTRSEHGTVPIFQLADVIKGHRFTLMIYRHVLVGTTCCVSSTLWPAVWNKSCKMYTMYFPHCVYWTRWMVRTLQCM